MKFTDLKMLVSNGESDTLEFKKSTAQLTAAFQTVCAFLNCAGGHVLIGVSDDGKLIGQYISDSTRLDIAREIGRIEPSAQIDIQYVLLPGSEDNKCIIVLKVLQGQEKPYIYDGRPYLRDQSTTKRMPTSRYDQLIIHRVSVNFSFEQAIAQDTDLDSLDNNLILRIARKAVEVGRMHEQVLREDVPKILESLKLTKQSRLTNAAVILFSSDIFPNYPQMQLKLARFKGTDRHEFLDSDIVYGNIFVLLDKGMSFIRSHIPVGAKIVEGSVERVETPIIPFIAIRESLINALCHSDYSNRSGSISVAIYDDRMEISNYGGLLPNVTIEQLKLGYSIPRNPVIAEVLFRCNIVEKWGRGIPEIVNSCKSGHILEPEFVNNIVEFKIIFRFGEATRSILNNQQVETLVYHKLSTRQQAIMEIVAANHLGLKAREIQSLLGENLNDRTLRRELATLRSFGFIEQTGSANVATWKIRGEKSEDK